VFFNVFLSHLSFLIAIVQNTNIAPRWSGVPSLQSAHSAGQLGKRLFRWPQSDKTWQSNGLTNTNPIPNTNSNPYPNPNLTLLQVCFKTNLEEKFFDEMSFWGQRNNFSRQLGPTACNLDAQLCRHEPATVLIEFLNWTGCVIMVYLVEFHAITKILLTLREITKKITKNFQLPKKSEKSRNITKSN
jgi:hypothetical protein